MTVIIPDVWAYCASCGREIFRATNGALVEATAREHVNKTGHTVLVSFEIRAVT